MSRVCMSRVCMSMVYEYAVYEHPAPYLKVVVAFVMYGSVGIHKKLHPTPYDGRGVGV
jgi:hypothetical protein